MDKNALSRKRFLDLFATLGAMGVLSACGSAQDAGDGADSATQDDSLADTIIFSQASEPLSLDPAYIDENESAKVTVQIYESLLRFADDSCEAMDGLAYLPEVSDDGLTYTFQIREGVTFHDGTAFNADAAKQNIDRQLEPNRTDDMPYAQLNFGSEEDGTGVESVEAPDDTTLVINLRAASTAFLANLAMCMSSPMVAPSAFDTAATKPVGTGQYAFVSWSKGSNITLQRYDGYWNPDRAAKTPNLIFTFIDDGQARVDALNSGEVDLIDGIDGSLAQQVIDAGGLLFPMDGTNINYMAYNTESETFAEAAARQAVSKAIDVDALVQTLYGDYGTVANSVMPLWMAPYDVDVEPVGYDPEAAKAECADLGITTVKCLTYSIPRPYNGSGGEALAEAVKGYLAEAGVDMQIEVKDWTAFKKALREGDYDICFYGWTSDTGDPDNFMSLLADANPAINVARYDNEEYAALVREANQTPSGDARDDLYHQCEQIVASEQPWRVISHAKNLLGYGTGVSGFIYHPTAVVFLWNCVKSVS